MMIGDFENCCIKQWLCKNVNYNKKSELEDLDFEHIMDKITTHLKQFPTSDSYLPIDSENQVLYSPTQTSKKRCYWQTDQDVCFAKYWIQIVLKYPLKTYSFDLPLQRNYHSKKLSQLMINQLGENRGKTHHQCKSKLATIRRKIANDKSRMKIKTNYNFFVYILDQAKRYGLTQQIKQLQQLSDKQSEFMKTTHELMQSNNGCQSQIIQSSIQKYIKEKGEIRRRRRCRQGSRNRNQ